VSSRVCSACSRLLDIYQSALTWLSLGLVFFYFEQHKYADKNFTGCKQILHIEALVSAMMESLASHMPGKLLRSLTFKGLISLQVYFRPLLRTHIDTGNENFA
jgi:hypothetical protein